MLSRPAKVGDKLTTHRFATGTTGFKEEGDGNTASTAICLMPGTEIAFDKDVRATGGICFTSKRYDKVAIFRQLNKDVLHTHHDALEFPDGQQILLHTLIEGQTATVLQLPAAPKTEVEAEEQRRVESVG